MQSIPTHELRQRLKRARSAARECIFPHQDFEMTMPVGIATSHALLDRLIFEDETTHGKVEERLSASSFLAILRECGLWIKDELTNHFFPLEQCFTTYRDCLKLPPAHRDQVITWGGRSSGGCLRRLATWRGLSQMVAISRSWPSWRLFWSRSSSWSAAPTVRPNIQWVWVVDSCSDASKLPHSLSSINRHNHTLNIDVKSDTDQIDQVSYHREIDRAGDHRCCLGHNRSTVLNILFLDNLPPIQLSFLSTQFFFLLSIYFLCVPSLFLSSVSFFRLQLSRALYLMRCGRHPEVRLVRGQGSAGPLLELENIVQVFF